MNLNNDVRRRLNLPPRTRNHHYDLLAAFTAGAGVGLLWSFVYLLRMGAF